MQYADKLVGDPVQDFILFIGCSPSPATPLLHVERTVQFFISNFGCSEYDPENEDQVVEFCQMVPAGAYGSPAHSNAMRSHYPDYCDIIDQAINAAWVIQFGEY